MSDMRLALVGGAAAFHARSFAALIHDCAPGQSVPEGWPPYRRTVDGLHISCIWDEDTAAAEELARVYGLETAPTMEAAAEDADGIIITDDLTMQHQRRAQPFLERGLPVFIDKPLSPDPAEAEAIIELAALHGAPLMSCSALRFAKETEELRRAPDALGKIGLASAIGAGELVFYGIHPLELAHSVLGPGIATVHNIGREDHHLVKITWHDGRDLLLCVSKVYGYVFQLNLYGESGWQSIAVNDSTWFYARLLEAVGEMVRSRVPPVPPSSSLEVIRALDAARRSLQSSEPVSL